MSKKINELNKKKEKEKEDINKKNETISNRDKVKSLLKAPISIYSKWVQKLK